MKLNVTDLMLDLIVFHLQDEIFNTDSDAREEIQIGSETLSLAPNFCQDPDELDRIFSVESWNSLAHDEQQRLMVRSRIIQRKNLFTRA